MGVAMTNISIFCDFDGTITETDNIVAIMQHFAPTESKPIVEAVLSKTIGIKEGVHQMFQLLPSAKREEIVQYVLQQARIRDGFKEFVQFAHEQGIPFYVVSGGIDFFVKPMLAPFGPFDGIYCNQSSFEQPMIDVQFPYACEPLCDNYETQACGCCKPTIMQHHSSTDSYRIVIGDSVTDFEAAKHADAVFARDRLQQKCAELHIAHTPFTTFYDCLAALKQLLEEGK